MHALDMYSTKVFVPKKQKNQKKMRFVKNREHRSKVLGDIALQCIRMVMAVHSVEWETSKHLWRAMAPTTHMCELGPPLHTHPTSDGAREPPA